MKSYTFVCIVGVLLAVAAIAMLCLTPDPQELSRAAQSSDRQDLVDPVSGSAARIDELGARSELGNQPVSDGGRPTAPGIYVQTIRPSGRPLQGVSVARAVDGFALLGYFCARTDAEGKVFLGDPKSGRYGVYLGARGAASVYHTHGSRTHAVLEEVGAAHLAGRLLDEFGGPLAGIRVSVLDSYLNNGEEIAVSGADGVVVLAGPPSGVVVSLVGVGYEPGIVRLQGTRAEPQSITLRPATLGTLAIEVLDTDGRSVGATVRVTDNQFADGGRISYIRTVAGNGEFHCLADSEYIVQAVAEGHAPYSGVVSVDPGVVTRHRIVLGGGATIACRAVGRDGKPAIGATLFVGQTPKSATHSAVADVEGRCEFRNVPPGKVRIGARHISGSASEEIVVGDGGIVEVVLNCDDPMRVDGRCVDPNGDGLPGFVVECVPALGEHSETLSTATDEQGNFRVIVWQDREYKLKVYTNADQRLPVRTIERVWPNYGPLTVCLSEEETKDYYVEGTWDWATGDSPNVMVHLGGASGRMSLATEPDKSSGRFRLGPIAAGQWRVWVEETGKVALFPKALEVRDVDVLDIGILGAAGRGAIVVDAKALDLPLGSDWSIVLCRGGLELALTRAGSTWSCERVPHGEYVLETRGDIAFQIRPASIAAGNTTTLDWEIEGGQTVLVELREGTPGTEALERKYVVDLRSAVDNRRIKSIQWSQDSAYSASTTVRALPGNYLLSARTSDGLQGESYVVVTGSDSLVELVLNR